MDCYILVNSVFGTGVTLDRLLDWLKIKFHSIGFYEWKQYLKLKSTPSLLKLLLLLLLKYYDYSYAIQGVKENKQICPSCKIPHPFTKVSNVHILCHNLFLVRYHVRVEISISAYFLFSYWLAQSITAHNPVLAPSVCIF